MSSELKPLEGRELPRGLARGQAPGQAREKRRQGKHNVALWMTIGGLTGAGLGFAYYYFVGCNSGHCLIGANPFLSLLFGGLFGLSAAAMMASPGP